MNAFLFTDKACSKLLKILIVLSIFLSFNNSTANAQYRNTIDSAINSQCQYIKLRQIETNTILYMPSDNFTVGDYNILRAIDFKLSVRNPQNYDTLKVQALYFGAGWISNVNKASRSQIAALLHAVKNNEGIWQPGYLKQYAHVRTYRILNAFLNRNHLTINDGIYSKKQKKSFPRLTANANRSYETKRQDLIVIDKYIANLRTAYKRLQLDKTRDSIKNVKEIAKQNATIASQIMANKGREADSIKKANTNSAIIADVRKTKSVFFRLWDWANESYTNLLAFYTSILATVAFILGVLLPFFGFKQITINFKFKRRKKETPIYQMPRTKEFYKEKLSTPSRSAAVKDLKTIGQTQLYKDGSMKYYL